MQSSRFLEYEKTRLLELNRVINDGLSVQKLKTRKEAERGKIPYCVLSGLDINLRKIGFTSVLQNDTLLQFNQNKIIKAS